MGGDAALAGAIACGADGAVAVDGLKLDAVGLNLNVNGRLDTFRATKGHSKLALSAPATFTLAEGSLAVDHLALATGSGSAVVRGKAGATIDLDVDLRNLPLALAGLANSDLDLSGTLSGTAKLSGSAATPNGSYDLTVSRVSMPDLARSGVGPLDVKANGMLSSVICGCEASPETKIFVVTSVRAGAQPPYGLTALGADKAAARSSALAGSSRAIPPCAKSSPRPTK